MPRLRACCPRARQKAENAWLNPSQSRKLLVCLRFSCQFRANIIAVGSGRVKRRRIAPPSGPRPPIRGREMAERSFKEEVEKLKLGDGEEFHGEGILAVTKALLQSGVSYVAGYQGAPISHLMDVL